MPLFWFKTGISANANFTTLSTGPLSVHGQLEKVPVENGRAYRRSLTFPKLYQTITTCAKMS